MWALHRRTPLTWAGSALLIGLLTVCSATVHDVEVVHAAPATFVVTSQAIFGDGTLAWAVDQANGNPGHDRITFDPALPLATVPPTGLIVTDAVDIDGCRGAVGGDPVIQGPGGAPPIMIQAADVTVQGVILAVGIEVTAAGDRFNLRSTLIQNGGARLRVTGAEGVRFGGAAPAPCWATPSPPADMFVDPLSLIAVSGVSGGIELIDTIDASVTGLHAVNVTGNGVIFVSGGSGTLVRSNYIETGLGSGPDYEFDPDPMLPIDGKNIVVKGAGTPEHPVRIVGGDNYSCLTQCVDISAGSYVELGAPEVLTQLRAGRYGRPMIRVRDSTLVATNLRMFAGGGPMIEVGGGSRDVRIGESSISLAAHSATSFGVLVAGDPAPVNTTITGNEIHGINGTAVQVEASDGVLVEGNVLRNANQYGVHVLGAAATGVRIAGNQIGFDPATGMGGQNGDYRMLNGVLANGAPGVEIDGNTIAGTAEALVVLGADPAHAATVTGNFIGVRGEPPALSPNTGAGVFAGAPGTEVSGNVVGNNGADGVSIPVGAAGVVVRGNHIGALPDGTAAPNAGVSIHALGAGATIDANTVIGNTGGGIVVTGPGGSVTGNIVGGQDTAISVNTSSLVRGNRIGVDAGGMSQPGLANATGIDVLGDDNTITENVISGTTGASRVVVVHGQRNTIHANSIYDNAGNGITLEPGFPEDANGGIEPPSPTSATATGGTAMVEGTIPDGTTGLAFGAQAVAGPFEVDVYANSTCFRGNQQGRLFLGTVPAAGAAFQGAVNAPPDGLERLTFTVTDSLGNTSEFSSCLLLQRTVVEPSTSLPETTATTAPPDTATPPDTAAPSSTPPPTDPGGATTVSPPATAGSGGGTSGGDGDDAGTGGPVTLPVTGAALGPLLGLAFLAVAAGLLTAGVARPRRSRR